MKSVRRSLRLRLLVGLVIVLTTTGGPGPSTGPATPVGSTTVRVRMGDDFFRPRTVTITQGSRVRWVNRGARMHTTTSRGRGWDRALSPGNAWGRRFRSAGRFRYLCRFHDGMVGVVRVVS